MILPPAHQINKESILGVSETRIYVNTYDTFGDLKERIARYLTLNNHNGHNKYEADDVRLWKATEWGLAL